MTANSPAPAIVPYDPTQPAALQKPDRIYLPYERFLELWEATKRQRVGTAAELAPTTYVLTSARYEGTVSASAVTLTGRLDITTANDPWVKVPLPFADAKVSALRIDGVTAAYGDGAIIVEKPGRHTVEVTLEIPRPAAGAKLNWGIPRTSATMLSLTLPDVRSRARINPGGGVVERIEGAVKRVVAALGQTDRISLEIDSATDELRSVEPASANFGPWTTIASGLETTKAAFTFTFPKAQQDRFTVFFEKGLVLVGLEALDVKSWKLAEQGDLQSLEVVLNEPAREAYDLSITCERPLPALPVEMKAPRFSAAAKRLEKGTTLFADAAVEVTPVPGAGLRQIAVQLPANIPGRLVAAYTGDGELSYRVAAAEARREARVDYVYQVNRRKIELLASLQLFAKGDDLSTATLSLPPQFDVQAVESERLQDWWREGETLHLRFRGATPEMTPLQVYLVRQYATAPTELEIRPLTLESFKKVSGEAVIAAHKGVDVTMKLATEARELAANLAATDFQILPPLERKRGFTFKAQNFAAQVALAPLPAKTAALWVLHAQAHEGWLALSWHAQLTMRQGSIDRVTFSLPAALPEARVSGGEVRETRSKVEGDRRLYEVRFQNDVAENVEFTVDAEQPSAGEVALPAITFPEAQMTTGYVLTDNASDGEMRLKSSGVDPVPVAQVPFLPELSKSAGVYRVQPEWSVTVGIDRLEKAATRAAFVAWAELTSALRRDGTEWHRATYRLQNRSLQFLPVKLPKGAELMSARVAGQSVRADRGQVAGQAAILVPLIKTKPGDLSYDVEVVYRRREGALGWWTRRELDDPELLGVTVERTFWNVWVPDERRLQSTDGNMEPVLAEVNKTEKLEGALEELKSLTSIMNSRSESAATRDNARANWNELKNKISDENNRAEDRSFYDRESGVLGEPKPTPAEQVVGKKGLAAQGSYVVSKRKEINDELNRETLKLAEADKAMPAAPAQQLANDAAPQSQSQTLAIQGDTAQTARKWIANGTNTNAPAESAPVQAGETKTGNNFYFNDSVVLQKKAIELAAKPQDLAAREKHNAAEESIDDLRASGKAPPDQAEKTMRAKIDSLKSQLGDKDQALDLKEDRQAGKDVSKSEKPKVSSLNTARGNAVLQQEKQQTQVQAGQTNLTVARGSLNTSSLAVTTAPPPAPAAAPMPAGQPVDGAFRDPNSPAPAAAADAPRPNPSWTSQPGVIRTYPSDAVRLHSSVDELLFASGGAAGGAKREDQDAQRLQPTGRLSLAVDFPTEGQLFHFKKLKASARLELTTMTPGSLERWIYLALGLVAGVVLWLLSRRSLRREALRD